MTDFTPEQLDAIERIRKLIRRAHDQSGASSDAEMAAAMKAAQAISARLNLDMNEIAAIGEQGSDAFETDHELSTTSEPWRRDIAAETARLYFCDYFYQYVKVETTKRRNGYIRLDRHSFVGKRHNIVVAKEMFVYFVDAIEAASKNMKGKSKAAKRSFCNAASFRLCERIRERYAQSKAPQEHGLIGMWKLPALYDNAEAALAAFMDQEHKESKEVTSQAKIVDQDAARAGYKAANSIGFDTQVGSEAASHALPKGGA